MVQPQWRDKSVSQGMSARLCILSVEEKRQDWVIKKSGERKTNKTGGERIRSVPWKMTLPLTISPMMHPTDQMSTEKDRQLRSAELRQADKIAYKERQSQSAPSPQANSVLRIKRAVAASEGSRGIRKSARGMTRAFCFWKTSCH